MTPRRAVEGTKQRTEAVVKPLLSICIPTYNRAELLRSALLSLVPQVKESGGEVELVVSDNCSTDDTRRVVEWARQFGPATRAEHLRRARYLKELRLTRRAAGMMPQIC